MGYIFEIPEAVKQMPWFRGERGGGAGLMDFMSLKVFSKFKYSVMLQSLTIAQHLLFLQNKHTLLFRLFWGLQWPFTIKINFHELETNIGGNI